MTLLAAAASIAAAQSTSIVPSRGSPVSSSLPEEIAYGSARQKNLVGTGLMSAEGHGNGSAPSGDKCVFSKTTKHLHVSLRQHGSTDGVGANMLRVLLGALGASARRFSFSCDLPRNNSSPTAINYQGSADGEPPAYCHSIQNIYHHKASYWDSHLQEWWGMMRCWRASENSFFERWLGCVDSPIPPTACVMNHHGAMFGDFVKKAGVTAALTISPNTTQLQLLPQLRRSSDINASLARIRRQAGAFATVSRKDCGFESGELNIGVHIRSGDLNTSLDIQTQAVYKWMRRLAAAHEAASHSRPSSMRNHLRFHIFSETMELEPSESNVPTALSTAAITDDIAAGTFDEFGPRLRIRHSLKNPVDKEQTSVRSDASIAVRSSVYSSADYFGTLDDAPKGSPLAQVRLLLNADPFRTLECMRAADGLIIPHYSSYSIAAAAMMEFDEPLVLPNHECPFKNGAKCEILLLMQALESNRLHLFDVHASLDPQRQASAASTVIMQAERAMLAKERDKR